MPILGPLVLAASLLHARAPELRVPEELARGLDRAALERRVGELSRRVLEPQAAPVAAAGTCYRLHRAVTWKPETGGETDWKPYHEWSSYVSAALIPNIHGIMTPWSYKVRAENLWMTDLRLDGGRLSCKLTFEKNDFPMDDQWDELWSRPASFGLGVPVVYASRILDRDFRAVVTLSIEPRAQLCSMPRINREGLTLPRD